MAKVVSGVLLLREGKASEWTTEIDTALNKWTTDYIGWLTTAEIALRGVSGTLFVHQLLTVRPGSALDYLGAVAETQVPLWREYGHEPTGIYEVLTNQHEVVVVWATSIAAQVRLRACRDAARGLGDLTDFTTEAELSEHDEVAGHRRIVDCADHGHRHGEVGTGFGESFPADCRDVDVVAGHGETRPSFDDGEQHRQPAGVEAIGVASSLGALRHRHGERLDFDEQRSLTGHRRDDDGASDPAATVGTWFTRS